ncbi:MAG: hypothetical protein AMXMBFR66_16230 [Pseudomonadota bacterium]|nr:hypothetical protein [Rubrivivax sp.]NLZ41333.1 hypothetical protein [Comamonadaceae bacterium]
MAMPHTTTPDPALVDAGAREALCLALALLDDAQARAIPYEMTLALAAVARSYHVLHARHSAAAAFALALRWAQASGSADQTVDLHCEIAETAAREMLELKRGLEADGETDPHAARAARRIARERARDHAFEAARLAPTVTDGTWEARVLLRASEVLEQCGDRDDAMLLQSRALRLMSDESDGTSDPSLLPSLGRLADA